MIVEFFPRPILVESDVLIENLDKFEREIKHVVRQVGSERDPMLNVDSTHKVRENIFKIADLKHLRTVILFHAKKFLNEMGYKNIDSLHFQNAWVNISHKGDYLFPHVHAGSLISGVYYVKSFKEDRIKFFNTPSILREPDVYTQYNSQSVEHPCNPGLLLIFPSDMSHGTVKQIGKEKIAISFNMNL
jgi:uncharacterized protein (TIGR02466 family)